MSSKQPPKNKNDSDHEGDEKRPSEEESEDVLQNPSSGVEILNEADSNKKIRTKSADDGPLPVKNVEAGGQEEERKIIPAKRSQAFLNVNELLEKEKRSEKEKCSEKDESDDSEED